MKLIKSGPAHLRIDSEENYEWNYYNQSRCEEASLVKAS